ncbi:MAG TPA: secretion protein [Cytophagales bacterium]|nr:secretion protein [Cytophagales bacterium]
MKNKNYKGNFISIVAFFHIASLKIVLVLTCLGLATGFGYTQPCFAPTITSPRLSVFSPNAIAFCDNNDTEVLSTQAYDTYQWYKRQWWAGPGLNPHPWVAITGANARTYRINGTADMLYYFKVAATRNACTEESPAILADGYAFGLPYIIANFQPGTFVSLGSGEYNVCKGASVLLENGFDQVYGVHTWYACVPSDIPPVVGDPCILPGVTGDTYTATTSGFYGFWACTEYCPTICLFLGLPSFIKLNFGDWSFCITGIDEPVETKHVTVHPNPASRFLFLGRAGDDAYARVTITDMTGKVAINLTNVDCHEPIDISFLPAGSYSILATTFSGRVLRNRFIKKGNE